MAEKEKKPEPLPDFEQLFPGETVELGRGITAVVFPPGLVHIRRFSTEVVGIATAIAEASASGSSVAARLLPFLLSNAMGMLVECVRIEAPGGLKIRLDQLPHWLLPPVVQKWAEISFIGDDKIRPWTAAIESLILKATGKSTPISEIFSKSASPQGTSAVTSSTAASPDSRTVDGASSS